MLKINYFVEKLNAYHENMYLQSVIMCRLIKDTIYTYVFKEILHLNYLSDFFSTFVNSKT